jgi:hypothetical protein
VGGRHCQGESSRGSVCFRTELTSRESASGSEVIFSPYDRPPAPLGRRESASDSEGTGHRKYKQTTVYDCLRSHTQTICESNGGLVGAPS